ncbi:hypothetical protein N780_12975 [Pontibacillus chungwhensis BH030062]|uniref:Uncharacterized protein n=2 Tax=Pontibacillus chungwhensis TaxID=265426 RepID=A0A0A2UYG6_9BACI|nr:hypothetical protein N780_12975 [Pontibacillus chungwhensis BH030062]
MQKSHLGKWKGRVRSFDPLQRKPLAFLCTNDKHHNYGIIRKDLVSLYDKGGRLTPIRKGVMPIDAYQVIMVMFSFGMFVLSLLSFVVKIVTELLKHKK